MDGESSAIIGSPVGSFQSPLKSPSKLILSPSSSSCDLDLNSKASIISRTVGSVSKFPLSSTHNESGNRDLLHQNKTPLFSPPLTRLAAKKYVSMTPPPMLTTFFHLPSLYKFLNGYLILDFFHGECADVNASSMDYLENYYRAFIVLEKLEVREHDG